MLSLKPEVVSKEPCFIANREGKRGKARWKLNSSKEILSHNLDFLIVGNVSVRNTMLRER